MGYAGTISDREEIEIESEVGKRGQSRFLSTPLEVVSIYRLWQAHRDNKQALVICVALMTETLERRFDNTFGFMRSKDDWDKRLSNGIIFQLKTTISTAFEEANSRFKSRTAFGAAVTGQRDRTVGFAWE